MVAPSAGGIVLVPFSDLSQAKLRPAATLADAGRGYWILFTTGSLRIDSYTRPGKLFTASRDLMVAEVTILRGLTGGRGGKGVEGGNDRLLPVSAGCRSRSATEL